MEGLSEGYRLTRVGGGWGGGGCRGHSHAECCSRESITALNAVSKKDDDAILTFFHLIFKNVLKNKV